MESDGLERPVDVLGLDAGESGMEGELLAEGEVGGERRLVADEPDGRSDPPCLRRSNGRAEHVRRADPRDEECRGDAEQGGLPRPIRAGDAHHFGWVDHEVDVVEDRCPGPGHADPFETDRWEHGGRVPAPTESASRRRRLRGMDFVQTVADASRRFVDVLDSTPLDSDVPSCPGWNAADLLWHLAEVQNTWGDVVERLAKERPTVELERPGDDELADVFRRASDRLVTALGEADPYDECWSWDEHGGGSVAWVRRRQAHEAVIHRVDAELAAGAAVDPIPTDIAADGIDELLTVYMSGIPDWADFIPGGATIVIHARDTDRSFEFELGRMVGTSLASGRHYDLGAIEPRANIVEPSVIVAGDAAELYL